ncbi:hypothetical protein FQN55_002933 [Onygenales sp. PD_40]|nr:hypothetical protein FQN55_002933 [Onygenales sp. PD_40]
MGPICLEYPFLLSPRPSRPNPTNMAANFKGIGIGIGGEHAVSLRAGAGGGVEVEKKKEWEEEEWEEEEWEEEEWEEEEEEAGLPHLIILLSYYSILFSTHAL